MGKRRRSARRRLFNADPVVVLFGLFNYKIFRAVGLTSQCVKATTMVTDTGAGPCLIRWNALPVDCEPEVTLASPEWPGSRLSDANGKTLVTSGSVTLWVRAGGQQVLKTFLVADDLSVPAILCCTFIDRHAHAILPPAQTVRWKDVTTSAIIRGPSDKADRTAGVSRVLRSTHKVTLPPRTTAVVWARTQWRGLGQVFGCTHLWASHRVAMANGVQDILAGMSFPVLVSNFSTSESVLRPKANLGYVEALTTGTVKCAQNRGAAPGTPDFCALPSVRQGMPVGAGAKILTVGADGAAVPADAPAVAEPGTLGWEGYPTAKDPASGDEDATEDGCKPWATPDPPDPLNPPVPPDPPDVADVELPDAPHELHERIRAIKTADKAMRSGQALGIINLTQHWIELAPGAKLVRFAPRRARPKAREAESAEVDRQLAADVIEPAAAEWGFPVVLVPKRDGTLRFSVDYRLLELVTERDSYPLLRMDECIDSLGEAKLFSTLDCNAGYWIVQVAPEDWGKTAFVRHRGSFRYKRMPFGLTNAQVTFQRALDIILSGVRW